VTETREQALADYEVWLEREPLAVNPRRAYLLQIRHYGAYLAIRSAKERDPLSHPFARDDAVRDDKIHLKTEGKAKPTSVNLALAALAHVSLFLGLDRARVKREDLLQPSPRALKPEDQQAFLRAVERTSSGRDQAIASLLFSTGVRLGECAALKRDDVRSSARKGTVIVRSGKGATYREVPLNAQVREALSRWHKERLQQVPQLCQPALFLNRKGQRLSTRAIDRVIGQLGQEANLDLSAHG
jgi:integrase/recombinase XerC